MSEFFDKYFNPKRIMADKREFKLYQKKISKLPEDYKKAMEGIQTYMFSSCGDESLVMKILYNTLDMFEENVALNRNISKVIGNDLGIFCENIHKAFPESSWTDRYKKKRQNKINKKFIKEIGKNGQ